MPTMSDADGLATIATGALIAREIDLAHAERPALGHVAHEACANCGTERVGPYCHACGQVGHVHRNLGALVHDIAHGVFHFEGKLGHTLPLLAWRPGELTRRYVAGERAKFVSPMALFLFSVFLLFAVVSHMAGHGGHLADQITIGAELSDAQTRLANLKAERAAETDADDARALDARIAKKAGEITTLQTLIASGIKDPGASAAHKPSNFTVDTGWTWLNTAINHGAENPQLLLYKLKMNAYKYSWALIPISLPFIWVLFFWRRDVGLYDHAIFAIYSLSFMSLGTVVLALLGRLGLPSAIITSAVLILPPVHMYRQLKGAYRLGRVSAAVRTFALLVMTMITSSLFLAFLLYLGTE